MTEGYPMEMHKMLIAWFLWGFWAKVIMLCLSVVCTFCVYMGMRGGQVCGAVTCALYVTNGLVWLAFGAIWRFSNAGQISSGDKLERLYGKSDDEWDAEIKNAVKTNGYQI